MPILNTQDLTMMFLAFGISWFSAYTSFDISERVNSHSLYLKYIWIMGAAIAMGSGIWAMHFVAVLALIDPYITSYRVQPTIYSLILAILGTGIGFILHHKNKNYYMALVSGIIMGLSIIAMKYIGLEALVIQGDILYNYANVAVSVFLSISAMTVAIWLLKKVNTITQKLLSSFIVAVTVLIVHFTVINGITFQQSLTPPPETEQIHQTNLALVVSAVIGFVLLSSLLISIFDRWFAFLAQKEAQILVESERKYRDLYRETPLPIQLIDKTGLIEDVSNSWLQMLGYHRSEVLSKPFTKFMSDESVVAYEVQLSNLITNQLNEYTLIDKNNKPIVILLSSVVRRDDSGDIIGLQEGLVNITSRKIAESSLRQKQKLEALGELVGGISHDFNNLLMIINGSLDMIRLKPETLEKRIDIIQETVKRGQYLTRRLLTFGQKTEEQVSFIDLKIYLPEIQGMLERSIGTNIKITIEVSKDIGLIQVDQEELQLTLVNLCLNSREAIRGRGYINIYARNENLPNTKVPNLRGQFVKLSVIDNGIGIDNDNIEKVIEPFFSTKRDEIGSGLGLAQVYGFATVRCKGTVNIENMDGNGTAIHIYIPKVTVNYDQEAVSTLTTEYIDGNNRIILVVEDDPQIQEIIETLLKRFNFNVISSFDAKEAIKALEVNQVFAVFTDIMMPGEVNGIELAKYVRDNYKNVFVGLITGFDDPDEDILAMSFPILKKPFTINSLQQFIRIALK